MYIWISLASSADLNALSIHISPEFNPAGVAKKLASDISGAVKAVLVEKNYIDKDYRSTYYNYYSKKGLKYRADCIRLHFFDGTVSFDPNTLQLTSSVGGEISHHYFGYMVLRPTGNATIGGSVLSPDVRSGATGLIITADHKVHLLGYKLTVQGFPSMDQHRDIAVCAHAACWSILRHNNKRHSVYSEFLTHDITLMAQDFNPGGIVPSRGLEISHAERVFQEAGTFPFHVARDINNVNDPSFYRQLGAYIESGFPLFAANHRGGHAMAVVGYEWRAPVVTGVPGMRYAWDEVKSLTVVDDNYLPYLSIPITGGTLYSAQNIDAFIVALPEKVFYPADAVDRLAPTLFRLPLTGLPPKENSIVRYFLSTGSGIRRFMRGRESEFDPAILTAVMKLPFAQFVWVVEFATEAEWSNGQISARAIIDATASERESWPLWLFHTRTQALIFSRESVSLDLKTGIGALHLNTPPGQAFSRMDQNLRPTQSK